MADLDPADQAVTVASVREEDGTPVVYLSGELDLTSAGQFSTAIDAALGSHPGRLILDASGLTFMDSSGIVLLVSAAFALWAVLRGRRLRRQRNLALASFVFALPVLPVLLSLGVLFRTYL